MLNSQFSLGIEHWSDIFVSSVLPSQRVRPNLEVHDLPFCTLTAFNMPDEVRAVVRPQSAAFPSAVRVVDAPIHAARVEPQGIRYAELDPLSGLRVQRKE